MLSRQILIKINTFIHVLTDTMSLVIYKFPGRNSRVSIEGNGLIDLSSLKSQNEKKNRNLFFPGN